MTIYIVEEELGPTYWLRTPDEGESLEGKCTLELTDDEFADYRRAESAWQAWGEKLRQQFRRAAKG